MEVNKQYAIEREEKGFPMNPSENLHKLKQKTITHPQITKNSLIFPMFVIDLLEHKTVFEDFLTLSNFQGIC